MAGHTEQVLGGNSGCFGFLSSVARRVLPVELLNMWCLIMVALMVLFFIWFVIEGMNFISWL